MWRIPGAPRAVRCLRVVFGTDATIGLCSMERLESTMRLMGMSCRGAIVGTAVAVVLLVAGCSSQAAGPNAVSATKASPASSGSADALSPSPVPAGQVAPLTRLTADQTAGMTSTRWRFSSLSPDGITVTVTWATGSCATAGYEATESDEAVQIRVLTGQRPPPSGFICSTSLTTAAGTIALSRPLGIRQLLHGPVG